MSSVISPAAGPISGGVDVVVNRERFAAALSVAAHAAEGKPGEQMVRFVAQAERREFQVFNRDVTVTMDVSDALDVDSISLEGSVMLPIQRLGRLLGDLNNEEVRITRVKGFTDESGGKIMIKWTGGECSIPVSGVAKYPPCDRIEDPWDFYSVDPRELFSGLRSGLVSVDGDSAHAALSGLRLQYHANGLDFVGTDGREMSVFTARAEVTNKPQDCCTMAQRGAEVACRVLEWACPPGCSDPASMAAVVIGESRVVFDLRGSRRCLVSVRLIEGRYPRYRDLLEQVDDSYQRMEVSVDQLVSALRQTAIVLGPENVAVELSLSPEFCRISSQTPEVGFAVVESEFSNVKDAVTVKLDLRRLLMAAQCIPRGSKVVFMVKDRSHFVSIRHNLFQFILMPLG